MSDPKISDLELMRQRLCQEVEPDVKGLPPPAPPASDVLVDTLQ